MKKIRLDEKLKDLKIVPPEKMQAMILLGEILVNGKPATSLANKIKADDLVEYKSKISKYVGRGGFKLEAALDKFKINPQQMVCVDFGACTGGFTDVLIQRGASKVFAVEKGKNQLAHKLKNNQKVVDVCGLSLFEINADYFAEKIDMAVCDLSFIPLKKAVPKIFELTNNAPLIALVKPHYEAQDVSVLTNGKVKDPEKRKQILNDFETWIQNNGFVLKDMFESPVRGGGRNYEYLALIERNLDMK